MNLKFRFFDLPTFSVSGLACDASWMSAASRDWLSDRNNVTGTVSLVIGFGPLFVTVTRAVPLALGVPSTSGVADALVVIATVRSGSLADPTVSVNEPSVAAGAWLPAASRTAPAGRSTV